MPIMAFVGANLGFYWEICQAYMLSGSCFLASLIKRKAKITATTKRAFNGLAGLFQANPSARLAVA